MTYAIRIYEHGGPDVMRWESIDLPKLESGEVRVRQTAIGVNLIDTYHRSGLYELPRFPSGLGMEACGVVEALGPGITHLRVGDRVAYASGPPGAYAEERILEAQRLVAIPQGIDDATAAAAMLKGLTVEYLLRRTFRVERGQVVLFHAAAGGVGLIACQWLRHLGATVIGTVSTREKAEVAARHGCDHPIVTTEEDFVERVRAITKGAGCAVAYDSVGKDTFERSLDCLRPRGMLVAFGNASGKPPALDTMLLARKGSLYVTRPTLQAYTSTREELVGSANELFDKIGHGIVQVDVRQRFALRDAADSHRALEARKTIGSTVLVP